MKKENRKQFLELIDKVLEIHDSNKVCVFLDISGHVDWFEIKFVESKNRYGVILWKSGVTDLYREDLPERLTAISEEVDSVMANIEKKREEAQKLLDKDEKTLFLKLKEKYETDENK